MFDEIQIPAVEMSRLRKVLEYKQGETANMESKCWKTILREAGG